MDRDPYPGDVDRQEGPAVFASKHTAGFNRLPIPPVKPEDPVGFRDRVPALDIGRARGHGPRGCGYDGDRVCAAALALVLLRSPSPCPHAQNRFWIGEGDTGNFRALFEIVRQFLAVEAGLARLPVDTRDSRFIDDHQGRGPGADRGGKVRRSELFQIKLDHHVFGDLPAFGGPVLQTVQARLHFRDAALEPCGQGLDRLGRRE